MFKINGIYPQQISRQLCNTGTLDCGWYHGSWHVLKSLGVVSTSAVHEQSINMLLTLALRGMTTPRVLLTGSTDETLLRLAHSTCDELGINAELYAVDICATPLAFMQAYANENQIELMTYQSDILEFETEKKFDIILTHAFMGYFDETQRPRLMHTWRQLLSDRGRIVTIQRVRPADSPALVRFTPQQADTFIATTIEAATNTGTATETELASIELAASRFAHTFVTHAIRSKTELESLFTNTDLAFEFLEYHRLEKNNRLSGPSVPSDAEFAHIIAKRSQG